MQGVPRDSPRLSWVVPLSRRSLREDPEIQKMNTSSEDI